MLDYPKLYNMHQRFPSIDEKSVKNTHNQDSAWKISRKFSADRKAITIIQNRYNLCNMLKAIQSDGRKAVKYRMQFTSLRECERIKGCASSWLIFHFLTRGGANSRKARSPTASSSSVSPAVVRNSHKVTVEWRNNWFCRSICIVNRPPWFNSSRVPRRKMRPQEMGRLSRLILARWLRYKEKGLGYAIYKFIDEIDLLSKQWLNNRK